MTWNFWGTHSTVNDRMELQADDLREPREVSAAVALARLLGCVGIGIVAWVAPKILTWWAA